jgi:hemerythrin superfamily protein
VPTREQVRALLAEGLDYAGTGRRLGIPPGQAYLIATGLPADGGDTSSVDEQRPGGLPSSTQHLANPPHENPDSKDAVREWVAARVRADAQMRRAAEERTAEPDEPADPEGNHDAVAVLGRDHNQVRTLVQQLQAIPSHKTGGSAEDLAQRKSIVDMITVRLSRHESAEEELFWPAVRSVLPDGDTWADGALEQEQEGKDTLTALGRLEADSDAFDEHVEQLVAQLRKHVAYEEQVFLLLREAMPVSDREKLGKRLIAAKKQGPARRRRRAPQKPAAAGSRDGQET